MIDLNEAKQRWQRLVPKPDHLRLIHESLCELARRRGEHQGERTIMS
ncbi:hypothetical protein [Pseudomonas spelaei]|nr:hypothetical protein [Pseudomonas spelaei]